MKNLLWVSVMSYGVAAWACPGSPNTVKLSGVANLPMKVAKSSVQIGNTTYIWNTVPGKKSEWCAYKGEIAKVLSQVRSQKDIKPDQCYTYTPDMGSAGRFHFMNLPGGDKGDATAVLRLDPADGRIRLFPVVKGAKNSEFAGANVDRERSNILFVVNTSKGYKGPTGDVLGGSNAGGPMGEYSKYAQEEGDVLASLSSGYGGGLSTDLMFAGSWRPGLRGGCGGYYVVKGKTMDDLPTGGQDATEDKHTGGGSIQVDRDQ